MIYLKQFENHNAYTAYTADTENFVKPNVSLCVSENEVYMTPLVPTPPTPTYDYVEIGGLKWATMNVGATAVTDGGLYFQWGDTVGYTADQVGEGEGKKYFGIDDCKYMYDDGSGYGVVTKYNDEDGKRVLDLEDDAAIANMGGNWRMPTIEEYDALLSATTSALTTDYEGSGVSGLVLTSKADSNVKLFFPAVGYANDGSIYEIGYGGGVWSKTVSWDVSASLLNFTNNWVSAVGSNRYYGHSVRGVMDI